MKRRALPEQDPQGALNAVREIYADLSLRPIERNCVRVKECCHFKLTGRTPYLTKGEALLAARALRATGRTQLPGNATGACPMLDSANGDCLIYQSRPLLSWGPISAQPPAGRTGGARSSTSFAGSKRSM